MALKYGPFNGLENAWDAYDFALYLKLFFGNGVFPNPSSNLQVVAHENMRTKVKVGFGFIEGHYMWNTSDHILQHDIADGVLKRIDRVVMRANFLENKGEIILKKGTPSSNPVAPTLVRNMDYYELALADVMINNGATVITQANITDQRLNTALCGVVATNINQLDTTTIAIQYQNAFEQMTIEQRQAFENWLVTLQDILTDGDVATNLAMRILALESGVARHFEQDASITQKGHVQLSNDTNSVSETLVPTMKALNEVKQYANDIKTRWANVVGGPLVSTDTQAQLVSKTQTIKNILATNINAKGGSVNSTDSLTTIANAIAGLGLVIKSIQRGIAFMGNDTSLNISITGVDLNNSILIFNEIGADTFNTTYPNSRCTGRVSSGNQISFERATKNGTGASQVKIAWQVIEFENIKSVQRGTAYINSLSENISISPVTTSKSFVITSSIGGNTSNYDYQHSNIASQLESSTITISRGAQNGGSNQVKVDWQVIEFK